MTWPKMVLFVAVVALTTFSVRGSTTYYTSPINTYYVGVEDSPSSSCDCDYNDLIFSVSTSAPGAGQSPLQLGALYGTGYLQSSAPSLSNSSSVGTLNGGSPFWNNLSSDSTYANLGECMYDSGAHNTCSSSGAENSPIDTTAQYLAGPGNVGGTGGHPPDAGDAGGSVDFYFNDSSDLAVTFTLIESIAGDPTHDEEALYACSEGHAANSTTGCIQINLHSSDTVTLTTAQITSLGGSFELVFSGSGFGPYSSNTDVTGDSDTIIDHFAVFVGETALPEPASFVLVGGALLGLGVLRQRIRKS